MLGNNIIIFDAEASGLLEPWQSHDGTCAEQVHCVVGLDHSNNLYIFCSKEDLPEVRDYVTRLKTVYTKYNIKLETFDKVGETFNLYGAIGCHNLINYDLPLMKKFLGIDYSVKPGMFNNKPTRIVDTLLLSRWLWPDRPLPAGCPTSIYNPVTETTQMVGRHGLQAWGYRVGGTKPQIDDWRDQPISTYVHRCVEDVINNLLTFDALMLEMAKWYKTPWDVRSWEQTWAKANLSLTIEHQFAHIIYKQATHGIKLDIEKAEANVEELDRRIKELEDKINPTLPMCDIGKTDLKQNYTLPKKLLKKDGFTPTVYGAKFLRNHWCRLYYQDSQLYIEAYGNKFPVGDENIVVTTKKKLTLDNNNGVKNYLLDEGWVPTLYNYKTGPDGKPLKDENKKPIPTTPKIKDALGNICPNLLSLDTPFAKDYVLYKTLCHRRAFIKSSKNYVTGILNHPRVEVDGRLPADMNTVGCSTLRCQHRVVANVPKPDPKVVFGKEMREMFSVDRENFYFIGYDASGIEARLDASEAFPYDKGAYAFEILQGDIHSVTRDAINTLPFMQGNEIDRDQAKSIRYGITYGAGVGKIASMLGISFDEAKQVLDKYWEANWATKKAIDKYTNEWKLSGKRTITSISGNPLHVRAQHSIYNTRLQNAGTTVMKLSACLMEDWNKELIDKGEVNKILDYHDEAGFEVARHLVKWHKVKDEEEGVKLQQEKLYSKPIEKDGQWYVAECEVGDNAIKSIKKAGELLGVKVELSGKWAIGFDWSVH